MCYNNDNCLNGGECVEDFPNHSYTCDCPPSTSGSHCEHGEVSLCHVSRLFVQEPKAYFCHKIRFVL